MENEIKKVETPYDDHGLEWNKDTGRYQLTIEEVKTLFDEMPIKSDSVVKRRIKDTSRLIYNYILGRCYTGNRTLVEWLLNHTENGRKFLKEVLAIQIESDLTTGINSLGKLPTVMPSGQQFDRDVVRANQICIQCEDEIRQSQNYFCGINLLYQAPYPYAVYLACGMR